MGGAAGPNLLLVVLDTARADAFEPYGAAGGASPTVAQLASAGTAAPAAFATSSWTVPSHASLFTGMLPSATGLGRTNAPTPAGYAETMRSHRDRLLPTLLGRAGYDTAGVSANLWVSPDSGFDTGFDQFRYVRSQRKADIGDRSIRGRIRWGLEAVRARADDGAAEVEQVLGDWLTARDRKPFFWFVNLVECHSPYLPPAPHAPKSPLARLRGAHDAQAHQTFAAFARSSLPGGFDVDAEALGRMHDLYGRSVRLMDDWLARVLAGLDRHGLLDETLVLVTSDHGENFGECSKTGHAFSLDERLIRIPMVASGPSLPALDGVTSLADVPRLLCHAAAVEHPYEPRVDAGVAVAELEPPCGPDDDSGHAAIADLGLGPDAHTAMVTRWSCATDGHHKLLRGDRGEVLIDLATDPLEQAGTTPAADDPVARRLRAALDASESTDRAGATEPAPGTDVDDLKRRMELLGYL